MRIEQKFLISIIALLLLANVVVAAGLFDDRFPSARFTAMGGSGVAVANDVWASSYNPAGLSRVSAISVGGSYLRMFEVSFLKNFFGGSSRSSSWRIHATIS